MATYSNNTTIKIGDVISYYRINTASNVPISDTYTVPNGSYIVVYRAKRTVSFSGTASITYQMPGQPNEVAIDSQDEFEYLSAVGNIPATVGLNPFSLKLPSGTIIRMNANSFFVGGVSYNFIGQLFSNTP